MQRRLAWFVPKPDGTVTISLHDRELTEEAYSEFKLVVGVVPELRTTVADFLSMELNYRRLVALEPELTAALESMPNTLSFGGTHGLETHVIVATAVSNFISSAGDFRHRTARRLRAHYGPASATLDEFIRAERAQYGAQLAYRILYNLRNYSAHFDSPISAVPLHGARSQIDGKMRFSVKLVLSVRHMLKSDRVQARVRREMQAIPRRLSVVSLAGEYMRAHATLMSLVLTQQAQRLNDMQNYARAVLSLPGRPPEGIPVIATGDLPPINVPNIEWTGSWLYFSFDELALFGRLFRRLSEANYPD